MRRICKGTLPMCCRLLLLMVLLVVIMMMPLLLMWCTLLLPVKGGGFTGICGVVRWQLGAGCSLVGPCVVLHVQVSQAVLAGG